jgi:hypothetical protein
VAGRILEAGEWKRPTREEHLTDFMVPAATIEAFSLNVGLPR